jgi:hypothetical protein
MGSQSKPTVGMPNDGDCSGFQVLTKFDPINNDHHSNLRVKAMLEIQFGHAFLDLYEKKFCATDSKKVTFVKLGRMTKDLNDMNFRDHSEISDDEDHSTVPLEISEATEDSKSASDSKKSSDSESDSASRDTSDCLDFSMYNHGETVISEQSFQEKFFELLNNREYLVAWLTRHKFEDKLISGLAGTYVAQYASLEDELSNSLQEFRLANKGKDDP